MVVEQDAAAQRQRLEACEVEGRERVLHLGRDREGLAVLVARFQPVVVEEDLVLETTGAFVAVLGIAAAESSGGVPVGVDAIAHLVDLAEKAVGLGAREQVIDWMPLPVARLRNLQVGVASVDRAVLDRELEHLAGPEGPSGGRQDLALAGRRKTHRGGEPGGVTDHAGQRFGTGDGRRDGEQEQGAQKRGTGEAPRDCGRGPASPTASGTHRSSHRSRTNASPVPHVRPCHPSHYPLPPIGCQTCACGAGDTRAPVGKGAAKCLGRASQGRRSTPGGTPAPRTPGAASAPE